MKHLKVLGPGCARCEQLAEITRTAADELGVEYELEKITDLSKFLDYGLIMTPGLVIDGKLEIQGRVPTVQQVKEVLARASSEALSY